MVADGFGSKLESFPPPTPTFPIPAPINTSVPSAAAPAAAAAAAAAAAVPSEYRLAGKSTDGLGEALSSLGLHHCHELDKIAPREQHRRHLLHALGLHDRRR